MTDRFWKIGVASTLGVAAVAALFFGTLLAPRVSPAARSEPPVASSSGGSSDQSARIASLAREINRLQDDLAAQKRAAEERPATQLAASAEAETASPPPSDDELHRRRVAAFSEALEMELRDGRAAAQYESEVVQAVRDVGGLRVESIDCRTSICRIELQNLGDDARERLTQLMFKALRYGTYDFMSPDRRRTTSFVGMPGHPLPVADPEDLERFAE